MTPPYATDGHSVSEWVPVSERMPETYDTLLLNCAGELLSTGFLMSDGARWIVTHWMKLPEPPNA